MARLDSRKPQNVHYITIRTFSSSATGRYLYSIELLFDLFYLFDDDEASQLLAPFSFRATL